MTAPVGIPTTSRQPDATTAAPPGGLSPVARRRLSHVAIHVVLTLASLVAVAPVVWVFATSLKPANEVFARSGNTMALKDIFPRQPTLNAYREVLTLGTASAEGGAAVGAAAGGADSTATSTSSDGSTVADLTTDQSPQAALLASSSSQSGRPPIGLFWRWLINSTLAATATALLGTGLAASAAYALSRYRFRGRGLLGFLMLLAQMLPGAVLLVPLYLLLHRTGLLGTMPGLVAAYLSTCLPFSVWMLKATFDAIPRGLDEAATMDGLTPYGTFLRIILPLAWPGIAVTAFFAFLTAWNEYLFASAFMVGEANALLPVGMAAAFGDQYQTKWHLMAAGSILVTLPVLTVFLIAQKGIIAGLSQGGIKG